MRKLLLLSVFLLFSGAKPIQAQFVQTYWCTPTTCADYEGPDYTVASDVVMQAICDNGWQLAVEQGVIAAGCISPVVTVAEAAVYSFTDQDLIYAEADAYEFAQLYWWGWNDETCYGVRDSWQHPPAPC